MTSLFTAPPKNLFELAQRPEDKDDTRLAHLVERVEAPFNAFLEKIAPGDFIILGYPDDRGVERNSGRTGAFASPDIIRKQLFKLTPSYTAKKIPKIWDLGNLKTWSQELLVSHEEARNCIRELRSKGARIISLGGGHDWAYPDYVDLADSKPDKAVTVINIDAHLDMRPDAKDEARMGHSGTPFRRIIEAKDTKNVPRIAVLGLQDSCNSSQHIEWAHGHKVTTLFLDELPENLERRWPFIVDRLEIETEKSIYGLSIDLDAFPQFISPGVSAPQVLGLDPRLVFKMIETLAKKTEHLGIYEYNPNFDIDDRSARLAARIIYAFLMANS